MAFTAPQGSPGVKAATCEELQVRNQRGVLTLSRLHAGWLRAITLRGIQLERPQDGGPSHLSWLELATRPAGYGRGKVGEDEGRTSRGPASKHG